MAEDFNPRTELSYKESDFDKVIRPQSFEQFSGQDKVLENLKVFVKAAKRSTMCCSMALRAWERQRWPILSHRNWV